VHAIQTPRDKISTIMRIWYRDVIASNTISI
jgi:hypothetical protein